MIAKLKGIVDSIFDDFIILDVNGIGFRVYVSSKLISDIAIGSIISIRIHHVFKQDGQFLCGFNTDEEMNIFKALLDVPGIGVKSALSVLSNISIEDFATAVATQDASALCKVNGIGKKTSERILLELKDKNISKLKDITVKENENANDAILGLISLGYQKHLVTKVVNDAIRQLPLGTSTNDIIVYCLKLLG